MFRTPAMQLVMVGACAALIVLAVNIFDEDKNAQGVAVHTEQKDKEKKERELESVSSLDHESLSKEGEVSAEEVAEVSVSEEDTERVRAMNELAVDLDEDVAEAPKSEEEVDRILTDFEKAPEPMVTTISGTIETDGKARSGFDDMLEVADEAPAPAEGYAYMEDKSLYNSRDAAYGGAIADSAVGGLADNRYSDIPTDESKVSLAVTTNGNSAPVPGNAGTTVQQKRDESDGVRGDLGYTIHSGEEMMEQEFQVTETAANRSKKRT